MEDRINRVAVAAARVTRILACLNYIHLALILYSVWLPAIRYRLVYNALVIALARAAMTVATWIFIVGITGSLIVILISFFEDLTELFGKE